MKVYVKKRLVVEERAQNYCSPFMFFENEDVCGKIWYRVFTKGAFPAPAIFHEATCCCTEDTTNDTMSNFVKYYPKFKNLLASLNVNINWSLC